MPSSNADHFFAARSTLNAVAASGYVVAVAVLVYAIVLHAQLDAPPTLRFAHASASVAPPATDACADASGIERGLCKADVKIDATKAKIKRHLAKRRLQDVTVAVEPQQSFPPLSFVRETLVWAAEQADMAQPARASIRVRAQPVDDVTPAIASRSVMPAGPLAAH